MRQTMLANRTLRRDPTQTTVLRREYAQDMRRRWWTLLARIEAAIGGGLLGAGETTLLDPATVGALLARLRREAEALLLEAGWQGRYIRAAITRGLDAADRLLQQAGYAPRPRASGGVLMHQRLIDQLTQEAHDLLANAVGATMADVRLRLDRMGGQWLPPAEVSQAVEERVQAVGLYRGNLIARTEPVRAHAEATLDRYAFYGLALVAAFVEYTAQAGACPICQGLERRNNGYGPGVYTIVQARGIIPVHPNCRCTWVPVVARGVRR